MASRSRYGITCAPCSKADDDGGVDVGTDAHGKDRQAPHRAAGENIQKPEQRVLLRGKKTPQRVGIHPGHRNGRPHPVGRQDRQRKENPALEFRDFQDVAERIVEFCWPLAFRISLLPPAFSIFSLAEAENACAWTVSAFFQIRLSPKLSRGRIL